MDYIRLFKIGKIAYKTINKGTKVTTVLKAIAKPAAEFLAVSIVGQIVEDAINKALDTYILKETE